MNHFKTIANKLKSHLRGFIGGWKWFYINSILSVFPSKHVRYYGLKQQGADLAKNVRFYQGFHIRNPKGLRIEDHVTIGPKCLLDGRLGLTIRHHAVIAYDAVIWTLNHDYNDPSFCGKGGATEIGPYAWICSRSIILPGIKVGEGAIIASGAIVTKDVPPYEIWGGGTGKMHRNTRET